MQVRTYAVLSSFLFASQLLPSYMYLSSFPLPLWHSPWTPREPRQTLERLHVVLRSCRWSGEVSPGCGERQGRRDRVSCPASTYCICPRYGALAKANCPSEVRKVVALPLWWMTNVTKLCAWTSRAVLTSCYTKTNSCIWGGWIGTL